MRIYEVWASKPFIEGLLRDGATHRGVRIEGGIPDRAQLFEVRYEPRYPGAVPEVLFRFRDQEAAPIVEELSPRVTYTDVDPIKTGEAGG